MLGILGFPVVPRLNVLRLVLTRDLLNDFVVIPEDAHEVVFAFSVQPVLALDVLGDRRAYLPFLELEQILQISDSHRIGHFPGLAGHGHELDRFFHQIPDGLVFNPGKEVSDGGTGLVGRKLKIFVPSFSPSLLVIVPFLSIVCPFRALRVPFAVPSAVPCVWLRSLTGEGFAVPFIVPFTVPFGSPSSDFHGRLFVVVRVLVQVVLQDSDDHAPGRLSGFDHVLLPEPVQGSPDLFFGRMLAAIPDPVTADANEVLQSGHEFAALQLTLAFPVVGLKQDPVPELEEQWRLFHDLALQELPGKQDITAFDTPFHGLPLHPRYDRTF